MDRLVLYRGESLGRLEWVDVTEAAWPGAGVWCIRVKGGDDGVRFKIEVGTTRVPAGVSDAAISAFLLGIIEEYIADGNDLDTKGVGEMLLSV